MTRSRSCREHSDIVAAYATAAGLKVLAAIVFWIVGRWLIGLAGRMLQRVLQKQKADLTLMRYIGGLLAVTLNTVLVVAILGYFGVQATTFAVLVAGIGIAIGARGAGCCPISLPVRSSGRQRRPCLGYGVVA